ncbi:unnamed protein product [Blepharisma stoltei]|uniref:mRNA export factor GLE1 n=1 Tax=Blepharisma stoltei TaxID=1481888 RepID=A0AAU9IES0_9CILI|nr:unnamed protein product [Blepharisma stoltei]
MEIKVLAGVLVLTVLVICRMFSYVRPSIIMQTLEIVAYAICAFILLYSKFTRVKVIKIKPKSEKIFMNHEICEENEPRRVVKSSSPRKIEKQEITQHSKQEELKNFKVFPEYDPIRVPSLINGFSSEMGHKDMSKYSEKYRELKSELTNQFESIDYVTKAEYNGLAEYLKNSMRYDSSIEERLPVQNNIVESYNSIIEGITQELNKRIAEEEEFKLAEKLQIEEAEKLKAEEENRIMAQKQQIYGEKMKIEEEKQKIAKERQIHEEKMQKDQQEKAPAKILSVSEPLDNPKPAAQVPPVQIKPEEKPENAKQASIPLIPPKQSQPEPIKPVSNNSQIPAKSLSIYSQEREVPFITPESPTYRDRMEKLIAGYDSSRLKAEKNCPSNIRDDINATVNQITSSRTDIEHLNRRIEIAINVLKELNSEQREDALYLLCERVTSAVQDKCDSIVYGPEYTLNFIDFILTIGKTYHEIRKNFFLSIINRRKILVPIYGTADPERIMKRVLLNDLNEGFNNDMCVAEMNLSRSYGILLASFYTHKESPCNVGDCWRWLSFFLNIPEEYIDRNYIPTLEGFLKVSGPFMKQYYSSQFSKIASLLSDAYLPMVKQRFSVRYQHKTFIAQLQKVINELLNN